MTVTKSPRAAPIPNPEPTVVPAVAAPPTAAPAAPSAGTGVPAAPAASISVLVDLLLAEYQPMEARILAALTARPTGQRLPSVNVTHEAAAPKVATLVRNHPSLAGVCDPAVIDRGVQDLAAGRLGAARLRTLADVLEYNGKLSFDHGWSQGRSAVAVAEHAAKKDGAMNADLAPVRDALARGKRTTATARVADAAQRAVAAAQARATRAQQKAATAQRTATRAAQAHADQHPTAAGAPALNPQGPSASVPEVNPQGPAPGR